MTATALVESKTQNEIVANLVLKGDLRGLNQEQKVAYYKEFCERLDLDPITQPFRILSLNGKEVLYCDRGGSAQLSKKHRVSHNIINRERIDDLFIVTAKAFQSDGRCSESIGAVSVLGLKGDALANAMMKAETKAKRRATLDLLGLGMLDESEVDSIENGKSYQNGGLAPAGSYEDKDILEYEEKREQKAREIAENQKANNFDSIKSNNPINTVQAELVETPEREDKNKKISWKDVIVHFGKPTGKIRGKKLGELNLATLEWLEANFVIDDKKDWTKAPLEDVQLKEAIIEGLKSLKNVDQWGDSAKPESEVAPIRADLRAKLSKAGISPHLFIKVAMKEKWLAIEVPFHLLTDRESQFFIDDIDHVIETCKFYEKSK